MVRKKALMVTHSYYPRDPRVRREAEALVAEGYEVDVICLRDEGERWRDKVNGVGIHRLPVRRHRRSGAIVYALEYAAFFVMACACVALLFAARGYRLYQTHTIPDFLVFSTILPRILGAPVVLDMHEVMPEFFAAKFGLGARHPLVMALEFLERISTRFASAVLTVSDPIRDILQRRGTPARKVTVVMNSADDRIFGGTRAETRKAQGDTGALRLAYHGMLSELYDLEPVIRAIAGLRAKGVGGVEFHILGGGAMRERYLSLARELGLAAEVVFHDEVAV
ncbi:MAG: glycosyltransferase, partial [Planctomycetota bacterium]|nr:glycosyltransferase [Planctomycetota bacterium]